MISKTLDGRLKIRAHTIEDASRAFVLPPGDALEWDEIDELEADVVSRRVALAYLDTGDSVRPRSHLEALKALGAPAADLPWLVDALTTHPHYKAVEARVWDASAQKRNVAPENALPPLEDITPEAIQQLFFKEATRSDSDGGTAAARVASLTRLAGINGLATSNAKVEDTTDRKNLAPVINLTLSPEDVAPRDTFEPEAGDI